MRVLTLIQKVMNLAVLALTARVGYEFYTEPFRWGMLMVVPVLGFLWFMAYMFYKGPRDEARCWNGGICASTGRPWEQFDTDSQGGRLYMSEDDLGERYYIAISYPGIDEIEKRRFR